MKKLELNLHKRILIVEFSKNSYYDILNEGIYIKHENGDRDFISGKFKPICKGSELTEDIAKGLAVKFNFGTNMYTDIKYLDHNANYYQLTTALESFISSIKAQGYYWGKNPIIFDEKVVEFKTRYEMRVNWERAESKTINPEKAEIFEIIE